MYTRQYLSPSSEDNLCSSLPVDPRDEDHKDPENIDYSVPRHARYLQNTWKRHQDTVFWIDIDLGIIKEGLKFYQTRSNAIILQGALPANCIVRAERLKSGEKFPRRTHQTDCTLHLNPSRHNRCSRLW